MSDITSESVMREQLLNETAVPAQMIWENELDDLGTEAPLECLEAHLNKAPDPESPTLHFLRDQLAQRRRLM
jgi:hypothetical protein